MAEGRSPGRWAAAPCDGRLLAGRRDLTDSLKHLPASRAGRMVRERGASTARSEQRACPIRRRWCATTARRGGEHVNTNSSSLAAQEMRAGLSNSDYRIRVQTTESCFVPMGEVVSVSEKAGQDFVR